MARPETPPRITLILGHTGPLSALVKLRSSPKPAGKQGGRDVLDFLFYVGPLICIPFSDICHNSGTGFTIVMLFPGLSVSW